jgi:hypothetical protein
MQGRSQKRRFREFKTATQSGVWTPVESTGLPKPEMNADKQLETKRGKEEERNEEGTKRI